MPDSYDVEVHGVKETAKSVGGKGVLEVSLMVSHPNGKWGSEFTGEVYPQEVRLKSDPDLLDLRADDLKELMASAAHEWDSAFEGWDSQIPTRSEEVEGDR